MNTLVLPIGTRIVATPQELATKASQTARAARKIREQNRVKNFIAAGRDRSRPIDIVRYSNRKLYMTEVNSYITHYELATLIAAGYRPRITLHKSNLDVTAASLQQTLMQLGGLSEQVLIDLVKKVVANVGR